VYTLTQAKLHVFARNLSAASGDTFLLLAEIEREIRMEVDRHRTATQQKALKEALRMMAEIEMLLHLGCRMEALAVADQASRALARADRN
jgi:hypothetical protein